MAKASICLLLCLISLVLLEEAERSSGLSLKDNPRVPSRHRYPRKKDQDGKASRGAREDFEGSMSSLGGGMGSLGRGVGGRGRDFGGLEGLGGGMNGMGGMGGLGGDMDGMGGGMGGLGGGMGGMGGGMGGLGGDMGGGMGGLGGGMGGMGGGMGGRGWGTGGGMGVPGGMTHPTPVLFGRGDRVGLGEDMGGPGGMGGLRRGTDGMGGGPGGLAGDMSALGGMRDLGKVLAGLGDGKAGRSGVGKSRKNVGGDLGGKMNKRGKGDPLNQSGSMGNINLMDLMKGVDVGQVTSLADSIVPGIQYTLEGLQDNLGANMKGLMKLGLNILKDNGAALDGFQDIYDEIAKNGSHWLQQASNATQNESLPTKHEIAKLDKLHDLMALGKFAGVLDDKDNHNITTEQGTQHSHGVQVCMCL